MTNSSKCPPAGTPIQVDYTRIDPDLSHLSKLPEPALSKTKQACDLTSDFARVVNFWQENEENPSNWRVQERALVATDKWLVGRAYRLYYNATECGEVILFPLSTGLGIEGHIVDAIRFDANVIAKITNELGLLIASHHDGMSIEEQQFAQTVVRSYFQGQMMKYLWNHSRSSKEKNLLTFEFSGNAWWYQRIRLSLSPNF